MIFLDVGAHEGQTLEEVVKPKYGFEAIYAFEPMVAQYNILQHRFGGLDRVVLSNYGLAGKDEYLPFYGDNAHMDSTLYESKRDTPHPEIVNWCRVVPASDVIRSLQGVLLMKLNCEGAEIPILDDLIDTGQIHRVHEVMIDFDIRKVEGMEGEEQRIIAKMAEAGFEDYVLSEAVMRGATHQQRIAAWLDQVEGRTW